MKVNKLASIILVSIIGSILGFVNPAVAQDSSRKENTFQHGFWLESMQDPNVNFYELQDAFNKFWENRTDYKGNGYKVFRRWEYINESRVLPDGRLQAADYVMNEYKRYMNDVSMTKSASGNWSIVGPTAYPSNITAQPTGMGRINAIAFHPSDANTIYVGSPSGGFWKTTSGGNTWTNMSNDLPTLGVSSILIHPSDPDIIYIGSGDRDADDAEPLGVFKSTDGGATWTQINNTMGNVTVGAMIMHPSSSNTLIAATSGGIFKTTDGGNTWSLKTSGNFKDIKFKPGDPTIVYAVKIETPSKFYRSQDTGDSWTQITSGIPTSGIGSRMVIGVSSANANYVYLVQIKSTDETFAGLLRSTDSGLNFYTQSTTPNILDYECDGSGSASQATYDLCITVDPTNANTVYVGSINNWKSTDGGVNWTIVSHWIGYDFGEPCAASVHADQHVYEWSPLNGNLYVGHDGGICYTANGGITWPEITGNLAITQIYKIGQGVSNTNYMLFGCQDNGDAATIDGSTFTTTRGGDGMECIIDYNNINYCYNAGHNGSIKRSTTGLTGSYSTIANSGVNGIDESGAWVTPYFLHNTDPNTMFIGYKNVWRSNNVRNTPSTSVVWTKISSGETYTCSVLEVSLANPDIIYAVRSGAIKRTDKANDLAGSVTWTSCTLPDGQTPTALETHPTDANIVYATAGYNVYKSSDKGSTWNDISGNLPALSINCIVYDQTSTEGIYIGNQTSVWFKNASMPYWVLFSNGLPPVDVRELEIYYDATPSNNRIKAGTYGRGLWQSDLIDVNVIDPAGLNTSVVSSTQIDLTWTKNTSNDNVMIAWSSSSVFGTPVNGTSYSAGNSIAGGGTVIYNGDGTSFNHSGLSSNTPYYYKAWSVNGSSEYSYGVTANETTDCNAYSLPFEEYFSAGTIPDCWRIKDNEGNGETWEFGTTSASTYVPDLTGNYAFVNTYNNSPFQNTDLITPSFDLTNFNSNIILTFKHYFLRAGGGTATAKVYYSVDNGANWTELVSFSSTANPSTYTSAAITAVQGQAQVKFKWTYTSTASNYLWAVDEIKITGTSATLPTLATMPVTGFSATAASGGGNVTSQGSSAVTARGVCWATSPNPLVTGNHTTNGSGTGAFRSTITGLTSNILYYVRAYATNSTGTNYGTHAILVATPVATAASDVNTTGFTANWDRSTEATDYYLDVSLNSFGNIAISENFEGFTTLTSNGDQTSNLDNYLRTTGWSGYAVYAYTSGYFMLNSSSLGQISTPTIDLSGNGGIYNLYFDIKKLDVTSDLAKIWHAADGSTFIQVTEISVPTDWTTQKVQISGGTVNSKVRISTPGGTSKRFYLDNIRVEVSDMITDYTNLNVTETSQIVTGLSGTNYYYRIRATGTKSTSDNSNQVSVKLSKASIVAGGNWSNSSTWTPTGVPGSTDAVIISTSGPVVVDIDDAICNNLSIESDASLTIDPAKAITINGTLTNNAGTTGLVVKSDATGTGSIIHSTTDVDGTFERYMNNADWANWKDGWHFLSSPVASQAISPAFTSDPYDFFCWYEPDNLWVNFKNTTEAPTWNTVNGSTNFYTGRGYMAAYDEAATKAFSGIFNVENVSMTGLTKSSENHGWYFLGNPFGSALTWDASGAWSLSNIAGVAKIWNEANQSYSDLTSSPSSIIPATNGFMVQVSSGTGSLVIPASKRIHSSTAFYKSSTEGLTLKAISISEGNAQESRIIVNPLSTETFDVMFDSKFLKGHAPEFFSFSEDLKLSTNSLPDITSSSEIILGFVKNNGNDFRIEAVGFESFPGEVYLHDLKTGVITDLLQQPVYAFNSNEGDNAARFKLKFDKQPNHDQEVKAYFSQNQLNLVNTDGEVLVEIFVLTGQKLLQTTTTAKSVVFNQPAGIYLVRIITSEQTVSFKIYKD